MEDMQEALEISQAKEFVEQKPNRLKEAVLQGGKNFSGGQRQRLCMARAFVRKPDVLILDDSTSAVDTATEAKIRESFHTTLTDTTKIIIAQRIASVEKADMIIVMNNGAVEAVGNHEQLLATSDIYREVYEQQTRGGAEHE